LSGSVRAGCAEPKAEDRLGATRIFSNESTNASAKCPLSRGGAGRGNRAPRAEAWRLIKRTIYRAFHDRGRSIKRDPGAIVSVGFAGKVAKKRI
jgi:hypothetical protein